MLSRNFRLQRVGDIDWLERNYGFSRIATSIDELLILDVSREKRDVRRFCEHAQRVAGGCFVPLALGGGIRSCQDARTMIESGCEKVVLNTAVQSLPELVGDLVASYGSQCVVGAVDFKREGPRWSVFTDNGKTRQECDLAYAVRRAIELGIGEVYLNSMDRDGTGQGLLLEAMNVFADGVRIPLILAGGAGNHVHLREGLDHGAVDAVATANLFNFIGDGLPRARESLLQAGARLAVW